MEKINLGKIRGEYEEVGEPTYLGNGNYGRTISSAGDDTVASLKILAEKINEIIDFLTPPANTVEGEI